MRDPVKYFDFCEILQNIFLILAKRFFNFQNVYLIFILKKNPVESRPAKNPAGFCGSNLASAVPHFFDHTGLIPQNILKKIPHARSRK
jgi:hypothetical protein